MVETPYRSKWFVRVFTVSKSTRLGGIPNTKVKVKLFANASVAILVYDPLARWKLFRRFFLRYDKIFFIRKRPIGQ